METIAAPPNPRPHVAGYLYATCEQDATGKSILSRKEFKTPIHISKPYWDGHSLLLNLMCPTAGMLAGDSVDLKIETKENAAITISNPSSLRIHKMDPDQDSCWTQEFSIAPNAFLENNPEWLILQGESSFTQKTSIDVAEGGGLFFIEAIAPGRIAHQEAFAFRRFRNRLSLRYDGRTALLEKHDIRPRKGTATAWSNELGERYPFYVSILLVSDKLSESKAFWETTHELQSQGLKIGSSKLAQEHCYCVKILARDPIAARKATASVRAAFYSQIGRNPTALRRQ